LQVTTDSATWGSAKQFGQSEPLTTTTDIDDEMAFPRVVTLPPTDALLGCLWTVLSDFGECAVTAPDEWDMT